MAESATRIRRLLADSIGECCSEDVEQRLDELHALADTAIEGDSTRRVFAALGNETRYRLARVLAAAEDELCVCELEPLVDVSESAVSHALSDLVDAGLATRRKDGNWRYYRATTLADALFETAESGMEGETENAVEGETENAVEGETENAVEGETENAVEGEREGGVGDGQNPGTEASPDE